MKLFWEKVKKGPRTNDCWDWLAAKNNKGYGRFDFEGKTQSAHRVVWQLTYGPIPEGEGYHGTCVLHKCDNPSCVRPDHLFLGSNYDNLLDKEAKGRGNHGKGETHSRAKLTDAQILEIRAIGLSMFQREIAEKYGISKRHVGYILNSKNWKHLTELHKYQPTAPIRGKRVKEGERKDFSCSLCGNRIRDKIIHDNDNAYHPKCYKPAHKDQP